MGYRMRLIIALALLLSACAPQPIPFEAGAVVVNGQSLTQWKIENSAVKGASACKRATM